MYDPIQDLLIETDEEDIFKEIAQHVNYLINSSECLNRANV